MAVSVLVGVVGDAIVLVRGRDLGLTVVDSATKDMCGRVVYPAAAIKAAPNPEGARAFLDFLRGDEASADFSEVGFTPLANN